MVACACPAVVLSYSRPLRQLAVLIDSTAVPFILNAPNQYQCAKLLINEYCSVTQNQCPESAGQIIAVAVRCVTVWPWEHHSATFYFKSDKERASESTHRMKMCRVVCTITLTWQSRAASTRFFYSCSSIWALFHWNAVREKCALNEGW